MICYVTHEYHGDPANLERAKRITRDLQVRDLANCYICPLTCFSQLGNDIITPNAEMALRLDILSVSDCLIVASDISEDVRREIEFANLVGMEVRFLETP